MMPFNNNFVRQAEMFVRQAVNNPQIMNNPMAKNALTMIQNHDNAGLEQMARNMCKEKGINPDDAIKHLRQQLGMR